MARILDPLLDPRADCDVPRLDPAAHSPAQRAEWAATLRDELEAFAAGLAEGRCALHRPVPLGVTRGAGHFHLAPELFLQVSGWTRFTLPQGECRLGPGEALLMPPRLRHDEQVGPGTDGTPFHNLVVYADAGFASCHLAHEALPGRPGITHLESCRPALRTPLRDWLALAAAGGDGEDDDPLVPLQHLQARALVAAALAGLRRALDADSPGHARTEPALIARLRVLVQNQLGDPALSVRRLAGQCGCSADHLSQRYRQVSGETLVAGINRLRLERAEQLLADPGLAIKEVAWACGYASPGYFIRSFRARHDQTPQAWREAQAQRAG